ncbi:MAG: serine/threonine-protein kinase [Pseudomonadota bacterium]
MICIHCACWTETEPCERCGAEPRLLGRYRLQDVLGRGASGTTWSALDPKDQPVAIKAIPLEEAEDAKRRELIEREVRVLRELRHPGIPAYIEHMVLERDAALVLYLVQELIPGKNLEEERQEHRYDAREVLEIIAELAGILSYIHGLSPPVIHRDVKPGNVMRRPGGSLCLLDFGSVRDMAKGSLGGSTVAGTFGYMAPEQFAGDADPRSDLYGLGATAVALLTRREPQTMADHANRLCWAGYANVPEGVHDLVSRLVEPQRERRAPSADWVRQRALAMLEAGVKGPLALQPRSVHVEAALQRRPRDWRWYLLAAGVVVAIGMVPWVLAVISGPVMPVVVEERPATSTPLLPPEPPGSAASDAPPPVQDQVQVVARIIGEDAGVHACLERHQAPPELEVVVLIEPPAEVGSVRLEPAALQGSELESCLRAAVFALPFRGVAVEKTGTVRLGF